MDEILVRIARALACLTRLHILSRLAREKELAPSELARDLGLAFGTVCEHLRRLSDAGIIRRRRSGTWCYCVGESPYSKDTVSGKTARWLQGLLGDPLKAVKRCGISRLPAASARISAHKPSRTAWAEAEARIHQVLFEALTAFTNVRRLQILRRLATGEAVRVESLMKDLHMSDAAVSRHMDKLLRRGYIQAARQSYYLAYRLAKEYKSGLHRDLHNIVASSGSKR